MKKHLLFLLVGLLVLSACSGEESIITEDFKDLMDQGTTIVEEGSGVVEETLEKVDLGSMIGGIADAVNETINTVEQAEEPPVNTDQPELQQTIGKVSRIVDGDTLDVIIEEKSYKEDSGHKVGDIVRIRLILLDTPETVKPGLTEPEPFGPEATAFAQEVLTNQNVRLEYDKEITDRYGRTLAYVYLEDGRMFNEMLLEQGLAKVVVFMPNNKYEQQFRKIEKQAKEQKIGIWSLQ